MSRKVVDSRHGGIRQESSRLISQKDIQSSQVKLHEKHSQSELVLYYAYNTQMLHRAGTFTYIHLPQKGPIHVGKYA